MSSTRNIKELVSRYNKRRKEYLRSASRYSEADLRAEFVDEFFSLLGWDVRNIQGRPQRYREIIRETRVDVDERIKKPDYEFRLGTQRKFFVEAKKPNKNLINNSEATFQIRRYGWSAKLPISIITNFEYLIVYDTTTKPEKIHKASHSRLKIYSYKEYAKKFSEIESLLSKKAVYSGDFDVKLKGLIKKRPLQSIDDIFVHQLDEWRIKLANDILRTRSGIDNQSLNEFVQRLLHRILFLRMCEDRGIQTYEYLKKVIKTRMWKGFVALLRNADRRFDSSLFDISTDPFCKISRDKIILKESVLREIIDALYYPEAPYSFSVFDSEFLGQVYEFFLLKQIIIKNGKAKLQAKPENYNRDVVFAPRPLIDYIVQTLIEPSLKDISPTKLLKIKILDPACGSGGFLLSAFDLLINNYIEMCKTTKQLEHIYHDGATWKLSFEKKKGILENCLFGVDRDVAATEVTKFSLLVKLLEDENDVSLPEGNRILPPLIRNVVNGDSLIDDSIYKDDKDPITIGPPLSWGTDIEYPFDFIIGNPPYLKTEDIINCEPTEHRYYLKHYKTAYRQFDKYYLFIERSINKLLAPHGILGFVVSNKFEHIESGKILRQMLSSKRHLYRLIDFGNAQLFDRKTTYTCLIYLSKKSVPVPKIDKKDTIEYELINSPKEWLTKAARFSIPKVKIPRILVSGDSWLLPNSLDELNMVNHLLSNSKPLKEEFDIFNGIQSSRNDVYVLEKWKKINKSAIIFEKDSKSWEIEKDITKPFFHNGSLKSFFPLPETALIIFPYEIVRNKKGMIEARVIPPNEMKTRFPKGYAWLAYNKSKLACPPRDIQPRPFPKEEWYRYGRDQALIAFEDRPKIIVGVNSLGDKYVYDESNTLLASGGTAGECAISYYKGTNEKTKYSLYFILALLNHKSVEYFCRKRGSPFRGGWYARGTAVLKEIPIPVIDFTRTKNNKRLYLYKDTVIATKRLCDISNKLDKTMSSSANTKLKRQATALKKHIDENISKLFEIEKIISNIELPK